MRRGRMQLTCVHLTDKQLPSPAKLVRESLNGNGLHGRLGVVIVVLTLMFNGVADDGYGYDGDGDGDDGDGDDDGDSDDGDGDGGDSDDSDVSATLSSDLFGQPLVSPIAPLTRGRPSLPFPSDHHQLRAPT